MSSDGDGDKPWGEGQPYEIPRPPRAVGNRALLQWALDHSGQLSVNWDALPRGPFWAPLFGYSQTLCRSKVSLLLLETSSVLGRPLTAGETDAMSYQTAKSLVTRSYLPPIWLLTTLVAERRARSVFRFPFYTPEPPSFNPNVFPHRSAPLLTGDLARNAWHLARVGAYALPAYFAVSVFLYSYATTVMVQALSQDPRMVDLRKALNLATRNMAQRRQQGRPDFSGSPNPADSGNTAAPDGYSESPQEGPERVSRDADVLMQTLENMRKSREQQSRDRPSRPFQGQQQEDAGRPVAGPDWGSSQHSQASQSDASSPYSQDDSSIFDDASPVAPSQREPGRRQQSTGGSAWDRIRSGARPGGNSSQGDQNTQTKSSSWDSVRQVSQQGRAGGGSGDGYTYSKAEEERSLPKEQAQKEFDAMLERERRGESDTRGRR